jgi:hypothetical protein
VPPLWIAEEWLDGRYAAQVPMKRSVMIWTVAIYCTQVARNNVMVSRTELWTTGKERPTE